MDRLPEDIKSKNGGLQQSAFPTGEAIAVFNQPGPVEPYNAHHSDPALKHWVRAFGGDWHRVRFLGMAKTLAAACTRRDSRPINPGPS